MAAHPEKATVFVRIRVSILPWSIGLSPTAPLHPPVVMTLAGNDLQRPIVNDDKIIAAAGHLEELDGMLCAKHLQRSSYSRNQDVRFFPTMES